MAENWIAVDHNTPQKPEVIGLAIELGISNRESLGLLVEVWIWADRNTYDGTATCNGVGVTFALLDAVFGVTGLSAALERVGWLVANKDGIATFPNFGDNNGRTAKTRKSSNRRVNKHREQAKTQGNGKCNASTVTKALPQEQEQEQLIGTETKKAVSASASPLISKWLVELFNESMGARARMTGKRKAQLTARFKDEYWRDHWEVALQEAGRSAFLKGQNDRGWTMNLEFFLKPDTVTNIIEGKYDGTASAPATSATAKEQRNADAFAIVFGTGDGSRDTKALQHEAGD
tara:strand:+ start:146 stop:1015 length:870 start_codon:yes stop_codon:yes gene_type:complete